MKGFAAWFTPDRRQAIQIFAGGLAPLAILLGLGTEGIWEQTLIIFGAVLQFISSLLSLLNVHKGDWGAAWAIVRGAVYALAMVVSPALVLLGFYDEATNATVLAAVSLALSALSNLVAVFTSKKQQLDAVIASPPMQGESREDYRARTGLK
jgi:hypothetical protein